MSHLGRGTLRPFGHLQAVMLAVAMLSGGTLQAQAPDEASEPVAGSDSDISTETSAPSGTDEAAGVGDDSPQEQAADHPAGAQAPAREEGPAAEEGTSPSDAPASPADSESADEARSEDGGDRDNKLKQLIKEIDALHHLRISGYLQTDLRLRDLGSEEERIGFMVRRGRVKFVFDAGRAHFVFELDGSGSGNASLRDLLVRLDLAEADDLKIRMTVGQFKVPLGLTLPGSSSKRLFPERVAGFEMLMPGQRDLGAMFTFAGEAFSLDLVFVNGATLKDPFRSQYPLLRPDTLGDVLARVNYEAGPLLVGASALFGRGWRPAGEDDPTTTDVDESFDAFGFDRWALGGHARLKLDMGLRAQAEVVLANNLARRRASMFPTQADMSRDSLSWYLWAVQSFSEVVSVGARLAGVRLDGEDTALDVEPLLHLQFSKNLRMQLSMRTSMLDPTDNEGFVRLQFKL